MNVPSRFVLWLVLFCSAMTSTSAAAEASLRLTLRSRIEGERGETSAAEKKVAWEPKRTALIVCDMWDDHWCKSAARRVGEMAGPFNDMLKQARARGLFIVHAPSTTTGFYKDTPQRRRAQSAPFVKTPVALAISE